MSYYHEPTGQIILTEEEKETIEEAKWWLALPKDKRPISEMAKLFLGYGKYKDGDLTF